jgi:ribA/ribD-fused uncharacterized protein
MPETKAILGFIGSYRWLSNFFIEPDGTHVEGEYHRAKCRNHADRDLFYYHIPTTPTPQMLSPKDCKTLGRKVELMDGWDEVDPKTGNLRKVDVMLFYVRKKFKDHEDLRSRLYDTRGFYLEETNHWNDRFWGVHQIGKERRGLNMLGAVLMQVRDEL